MPVETHGRWPLVGAVALVPTSAAAVSQPALRPLAALLWHQTEEWVWPGSFLPWINREVLGSGEDEFRSTADLDSSSTSHLGGGSASRLALASAPLPRPR